MLYIGSPKPRQHRLLLRPLSSILTLDIQGWRFSGVGHGLRGHQIKYCWFQMHEVKFWDRYWWHIPKVCTLALKSIGPLPSCFINWCWRAALPDLDCSISALGSWIGKCFQGLLKSCQSFQDRLLLHIGMEGAAASFEGGEALVGEVGYLASHLQVRIRNIHPSTIAGFQIDYISKIKLVIYRVIQCSLCIWHTNFNLDWFDQSCYPLSWCKGTRLGLVHLMIMLGTWPNNFRKDGG